MSQDLKELRTEAGDPCYLQSQTKVAAIIKKGTSFSATRKKLVLGDFDKNSGLKLYILYMFILI